MIDQENEHVDRVFGMASDTGGAAKADEIYVIAGRGGVFDTLPLQGSGKGEAKLESLGCFTSFNRPHLPEYASDFAQTTWIERVRSDLSIHVGLSNIGA